MRPLHHEDFTLFDQRATASRFALDDEREALAAQHARRRAETLGTSPRRSMFAWLQRGIESWLSLRTAGNRSGRS